MANTSAIWQQAEHTTYQPSSPGKKSFRIFWKKRQQTGPFSEKSQNSKRKRTRQKNKRGDRNGESNESPEIQDWGESNIPAPTVGTLKQTPDHVWNFPLLLERGRQARSWGDAAEQEPTEWTHGDEAIHVLLSLFRLTRHQHQSTLQVQQVCVGVFAGWGGILSVLDFCIFTHLQLNHTVEILKQIDMTRIQMHPCTFWTEPGHRACAAKPTKPDKTDLSIYIYLHHCQQTCCLPLWLPVLRDQWGRAGLFGSPPVGAQDWRFHVVHRHTSTQLKKLCAHTEPDYNFIVS